jgi:UDP-2,3-diacylglucosamine pyrophosphatase LpxH
MAEGPRAPDLVVLSDLHLGEGLVGRPPRFSPMEDFFYDQEFCRLLSHLRWEYLSDPTRLKLVLNGDIFDFLTVTTVPGQEEAAAQSLRVSSTERRFGLNPTPKKSVYKLDQIITGHRAFFTGLTQFVAAGFTVELLPGNHDLELYFPEVREQLYARLLELPGAPSAAELRARLTLHPWFYLEPGRVYIEHGNQYESSNSIRNPLRPLLPDRKSKEGEPVLDYPLGSFFVRFFYNPIHRINPHTPKVISFEQYLEFLRRHNLLDLMRIARAHWPFFTRALSPEPIGGTLRPELASAASDADCAPPLPYCHELSELKLHPLVSSKAALARQMAKPVLRRLAWVSGLSFVTLYLWLVIFNLIQATPWLAENVFAKAILLVFFAVVTVAGLFWLGNRVALRMRHRSDETVELCAQRAGEIARVCDVPLVLMGHTHVVDIRAVGDDHAVYANSGTWTAVDNPWDRLHPDARRFTFLRVVGTEVEICRWNDLAGRIDPVPLFDLPEDRDLEPGALGELARPKPPVAPDKPPR